MGFKDFLKFKSELVEKDDYQNFRDQMNTIKAQAQQQGMMISSQNIAGVLQNNPNSWMLESCSTTTGCDPYMQSVDVRIRFFDPQVASLFMWACRNSIQAAEYGVNPVYYTSSPVMQQESEPEPEDKEPGQHYVKDFGDD